MEMGAVCGTQSGLVDVWVMHGMVMDETLHVFSKEKCFSNALGFTLVV